MFLCFVVFVFHVHQLLCFSEITSYVLSVMSINSTQLNLFGLCGVLS